MTWRGGEYVESTRERGKCREERSRGKDQVVGSLHQAEESKQEEEMSLQCKVHSQR